MTRRRFLSLLAAVPVLGPVVATAAAKAKPPQWIGHELEPVRSVMTQEWRERFASRWVSAPESGGDWNPHCQHANVLRDSRIPPREFGICLDCKERVERT